MRSVNKVIIIGNLTRDPEMRQTPNGQFVATFAIATNREWISRDGKKHSLPEYHDVVAWAKLAEICQTYLKKGKLIYIEGYLKTRSWDSPEGIKKFKTEIVVQDLIMLDKRVAGNAIEEYIPEEDMMVDNNESRTAQAHPEIKTPSEKPLEKSAAPSKPVNVPPPQASQAPQIVPTHISIDDDLGL